MEKLIRKGCGKRKIHAAKFILNLVVCFRQPEDYTAEEGHDAENDLFEDPWWAHKLAADSSAWWLSALDGERLSQLPGKQRVGLVNALMDLLRHLVCCRRCDDKAAHATCGAHYLST